MSFYCCKKIQQKDIYYKSCHGKNIIYNNICFVVKTYGKYNRLVNILLHPITTGFLINNFFQIYRFLFLAKKNDTLIKLIPLKHYFFQQCYWKFMTKSQQVFSIHFMPARFLKIHIKAYRSWKLSVFTSRRSSNKLYRKLSVFISHRSQHGY